MPVVEIETETGQTIKLDWTNCVIRTYKDSAFNHIEWYPPEGDKLGFITPQNVMDYLFELEFPYTFSPAIAEEEREWFVTTLTDGLDDDLAGLADPPRAS